MRVDVGNLSYRVLARMALGTKGKPPCHSAVALLEKGFCERELFLLIYVQVNTGIWLERKRIEKDNNIVALHFLSRTKNTKTY